MKLTIPQPTRPKMKDYGIHTDTDNLLPWSWVTERLESSQNYWIASTRPDGRPHAAPVWGVLMEDTVIFGTGATSRKYRNLQQRPDVVLHLESGLEAVIIEGTVERVMDRHEIERIAPVYAAKYAAHGYEPTADDLAQSILLRVQPQVVMAWMETSFPETATRWDFR